MESHTTLLEHICLLSHLSRNCIQYVLRCCEQDLVSQMRRQRSQKICCIHVILWCLLSLGCILLLCWLWLNLLSLSYTLGRSLLISLNSSLLIPVVLSLSLLFFLLLEFHSCLLYWEVIQDYFGLYIIRQLLEIKRIQLISREETHIQPKLSQQRSSSLQEIWIFRRSLYCIIFMWCLYCITCHQLFLLLNNRYLRLLMDLCRDLRLFLMNLNRDWELFALMDLLLL